MLKNAKIETHALDQHEQERMLQQYKQEQIKKRREESSQQIPLSQEFEQNEQERMLQAYKQKQVEGRIEENIRHNAGSSAYHPQTQHPKAPGSTNKPPVPVSRTLDHAHRNTPAANYASNSLPRPSKNNHIYDIPDRNGQQLQGQRSVQDEHMLGHHSNSAHNILTEQSDLSPQQQVAAQPSPGGSYHVYSNIAQYSDDQRTSPGNVYSNHPLDHQQPTDDVRAIAPPPQGHANFNFGVNSAVQVSDPPRYGVIRWMGTLSGITGPIAGVELVSFWFFGNTCTVTVGCNCKLSF